MDIGNCVSGLRYWEDVLTHKAYTQCLVGRLVCLFRSCKMLPLARDHYAEKLIRLGPRPRRRDHVERLRSQWLRKTSLLPVSSSTIECTGAQYDIAVPVYVEHRDRQNLCGFHDRKNCTSWRLAQVVAERHIHQRLDFSCHHLYIVLCAMSTSESGLGQGDDQARDWQLLESYPCQYLGSCDCE